MKDFKIKNIALVLLLFGVVFYGCEGLVDLETENTNAPVADTDDPGDIETAVASQYHTWFTAVDMTTPMMALSVASGEITSSWGNFGMEDMGNITAEGRAEAFNNSPAYAYASVAENPWSNLYTAISSANDAVYLFERSEDPLEFDSQAENDRVISFGYFILGLSYTSLANIYDQGFIVEPDTDLEEEELDLQPYNEVHAYGMDMFQKAIDVAEASDFEAIPDRWLRTDVTGSAIPKDEFIGIIYAYMARHLVQMPRDGQERDDLQLWEKVTEYADEALDRMGGYHDLTDNVAEIWSSRAGGEYFYNNPLWTRTSYYTIGYQDESGNYEDWLNTWYHDRNEFILDTPDARVAGQDPDADGAGSTQAGKYFYFAGGSWFSPGRGTYVFSMYDWDRTGTHTGAQIPQFRPEELNLYEAEYELRFGDESAAVAIINQSRTQNGEMEPLDAAELTTEEIWNEYYYEFRIETYGIGQAQHYFNARGWDDYQTENPLGGLMPGTPVHLPVPGSELELLDMENYTYGGDGPGSASMQFGAPPQVVSPEVQRRINDERKHNDNIETH